MRLRFNVSAIGFLAAACLAIPSLAAAAPMASRAASPPESPAGAAPARTAVTAATNTRPTLVYSHLSLPNGDWAQVYSDGVAEVYRVGGTDSASEVLQVPLLNPNGGTSPAGNGALELPEKGQLISDLVKGRAAPYAPGEVVVVYQPGVTASSAPVSNVLSRLGVDRTRQLFAGAARQRMVRLRDAAQLRLHRQLLDFPAAEVLHITGSSVAAAVSRLRAEPGVAYAGPDWTVSTTNTPPEPVPAAALSQARAQSATLAARAAHAMAGTTASGVPDNYTLTSSAQSLLNRPGVDAVPAYAALAKYGQLPGQGEIITNVSLGTLDDASAAANPSDPCHNWVEAEGPTTEVINNQRYLDLPSMPLIPAYTASSGGMLDPTGETCGNDDPLLTEVGLDFSTMAPLPHEQQRPGEVGSGLTDLLGIAPGANYRLVIPATQGGAVSDVDAAFAAAATQTPRPNVITASLGFGLDADGFPTRYLEDDPVTEALLASIVNSGIVVCVSAGDGLRTTTNAAVPPSGGAVATDVASTASQVTNLSDVEFSSAVSRVPDSGAIDVGGSTLNDISAAPPQDPANAQTSYLQAYPATRYDGGRLYASGFGSRVNVSAPGDGILSFSHALGGNADAVAVGTSGGTSAAAPETAAAAAIVLQVARLTHDSALASDPLTVRAFLESSGTKLPAVPQSDTPISVGPQVDVGRAVESLLAQDGQRVAPGVARVAVAQRHQGSALGGSFSTATDPTSIPLTGRLANAWITIAPDWTGLSGPGHDVQYELSAAAGPKARLADTPWARLQPSAILAAAGLPLASAGSQGVPLVYSAIEHGTVVAQATFTLTFGPTDGTVQSVLAPVVPPVADGPVIPVRYDISNLTAASSPVLVVSQPGRVDPVTGEFFRPSYTAALTASTGTVDVPVADLPGAGIYGIGIQDGPGGVNSNNDSAFTFTRVSPAGDAMPDPPTLSAGDAPAGHFLEFPYHGSFQLHYDVSDVPRATGAVAEFSAPGPTTYNLYNTFNNPNGSERDANGRDTGSVAYVPLPGTAGTVTLNGRQLGLDPTMDHVVRVLATAHGHVVGEASGVSTILMDGVASADGGSVAAGFGVNEAGTDGFLTSNQVTASGSTLGSVETFNQSTAAVSTVVSSPDEYVLDNGCGGMVGKDVGLYDDFNPATQNDTFPVLNPVATGTAGGSWTPPASMTLLTCEADNQSSAPDAVLGRAGSSEEIWPVDFATNTTGAPIDLSPALASMRIPIMDGMSQVSGQAYVAMSDLLNPAAPDTIADVDLNSGQVTSFPAPPVTPDNFFGLAVNPAASEALGGSYGGFGLYDLTSHAATLVQPGGISYDHPEAIPGTRDFLVQEDWSPDFFGSAPNNNTMSSILVVDEHGNVLHRFEQFNFFRTFTSNAGAYLQASSATSTAFTLGPNGGELYPFAYTSH